MAAASVPETNGFIGMSDDNRREIATNMKDYIKELLPDFSDEALEDLLQRGSSDILFPGGKKHATISRIHNYFTPPGRINIMSDEFIIIAKICVKAQELGIYKTCFFKEFLDRHYNGDNYNYNRSSGAGRGRGGGRGGNRGGGRGGNRSNGPNSGRGNGRGNGR